MAQNAWPLPVTDAKESSDDFLQDLEMARVLLQYGANPYHKDARGLDAHAHALATGKAVLSLLLEKAFAVKWLALEWRHYQKKHLGNSSPHVPTIIELPKTLLESIFQFVGNV